MVQSPWSLFPYILPNSSYEEPVNVPATGPDVGPFVCPRIPVPWLPYVLGALAQWRMPIAWKVVTEADVASIMAQVDELIGNVAVAGMCDERGTVSLTVPIGSSSASATVTFPIAFTVAPVVVSGSDSPLVIASTSAVTAVGFVASITVATPAVTAITALFSWIAGPAT